MSTQAATTPALTPADAAALVTLRVLLEEAVRRTSDGTSAGRRVSAILLDGTCEAAISLGLGYFNDSPRDKDSLDDLYGRLVEHIKAHGSLSPQERIAGWPDVRRLRRVRNSAQHHQIVPDHASLVGWSGSVQRFVEAIVEHVFAAQLSMVVLADSIADPELRQLFSSAEELLEQDDHESSIRALKEVFRAARKKWDAEHRDATMLHRGSVLSSRRTPKDLEELVESRVDRMRDMLSVATFALDPGEYVWWQSLANSLRTTSAVPLSAQDARRAAAFVLSWILRWESFSSTYTRDRLGRPERRPIPASPRSDGAPVLLGETVKAEISRRAPSHRNAPDELVRRVSIDYAAGRNDSPDATPWDHYIGQAFTQLGADISPRPWESVSVVPGTITLTMFADLDPALVVSRISDALELAASIQNAAALRAAEQAAKGQALREVVSTLGEALGQLTTAHGEKAFIGFTPATQATGSILTARFCPRLTQATNWYHETQGGGPFIAVGLGSITVAGFALPLDTPPVDAVDAAARAVLLLESIRQDMEEERLQLEAHRADLEARFRNAASMDDG